MLKNKSKPEYHSKVLNILLCFCVLAIAGCEVNDSRFEAKVGVPIAQLPCNTKAAKDKLAEYFSRNLVRISTETLNKEETDFEITTDWYRDDPNPPRRLRDVQYIIRLEQDRFEGTTNAYLNWTARARGVREEKYQEKLDIQQPKQAAEIRDVIKNICGS